eukprot:m.287923 g.287923  ORF g.287923 m.287923 type:complete len:358 (+) comp11868_c0_seq1:58-1131(+)
MGRKRRKGATAHTPVFATNVRRTANPINIGIPSGSGIIINSKGKHSKGRERRKSYRRLPGQALRAWCGGSQQYIKSDSLRVLGLVQQKLGKELERLAAVAGVKRHGVEDSSTCLWILLNELLVQIGDHAQFCAKLDNDMPVVNLLLNNCGALGIGRRLHLRDDSKCIKNERAVLKSRSNVRSTLAQGLELLVQPGQVHLFLGKSGLGECVCHLLGALHAGVGLFELIRNDELLVASRQGNVFDRALAIGPLLDFGKILKALAVGLDCNAVAVHGHAWSKLGIARKAACWCSAGSGLCDGLARGIVHGANGIGATRVHHFDRALAGEGGARRERCRRAGGGRSEHRLAAHDERLVAAN